MFAKERPLVGAFSVQALRCRASKQFCLRAGLEGVARYFVTGGKQNIDNPYCSVRKSPTGGASLSLFLVIKKIFSKAYLSSNSEREKHGKEKTCYRENLTIYA